MKGDPKPDRYRFLFEHSADPLMVLENGRFTECNQAAISMFGFQDKSEILNLHPSQLSPEYQPDGRRSLDESKAIIARTANVSHQRFEWTHMRSDGSLFPVEVSLTALPGEHGHMVHTALRDISARKQLETEHRHFQKMDTIGKLAGGIAHDFNNHLVPIIGYSEMLTDKLRDDEEARQWASEIHRAARISAMMVRKILAISHKEVGEPVVVEVNKAIGKLLDMLHTLIGENIRIDFKPAHGPLHVRIGAGDIDQILLNLATNARDAMPEGGYITIATSCEDSSQVCLVLSDDGVGMDEATASNACEPFFTTKELGTGTGLGLSTVYGIVADAGGEIDIRSRPNVGTTVSVRLPLVDEARITNQEADVQPVFHKGQGSHRGHVLLVEDNPHVSKIINMILESAGYRVTIAEDGQQGLEQIEHESPDVILSDVIMRGMSGPDMIKELGDADTIPPVVFMSGYTEDRLIEQGQDMSGFPLLRKPCSATDLLDTIASAMSTNDSL